MNQGIYNEIVIYESDSHEAFDIKSQEVALKIPMKCRIFLLQKLPKLQTTYQILVRYTTEKTVQLMFR